TGGVLSECERAGVAEQFDFFDFSLWRFVDGEGRDHGFLTRPVHHRRIERVAVPGETDVLRGIALARQPAAANERAALILPIDPADESSRARLRHRLRRAVRGGALATFDPRARAV